MTILCANGTHVYRVGNLHCTCGAAANGYTPTSGVAMYGFPPSYNPFSPHAPAKPTTPDVPLSRLKAAQLARASHLSADGQYAYTVRYGRVLQAEWKGYDFGAWLDIGEEMPGDAVAL